MITKIGYFIVAQYVIKIINGECHFQKLFFVTNLPSVSFKTYLRHRFRIMFKIHQIIFC